MSWSVEIKSFTRVLSYWIKYNSPEEKINSVFHHILFTFRADTTSAIPSSIAVIMAMWLATCGTKYYDQRREMKNGKTHLRKATGPKGNSYFQSERILNSY